MASDKSQKDTLIEDISRQLAQENALLAPIVREAARLAYLCNDPEHRLLFALHLAGTKTNESSSVQQPRWLDPNKQPKLDVDAAFRDDRDTPTEIIELPVAN
jgi:hypothetical protein